MTLLEQFLILIGFHSFDLMGNSDYVIENKGKNIWIMTCHCVWWTGWICAGLLIIDKYAFWKIPFLFIIHFITDEINKNIWQPRGESLLKDQFIHFLQLILVFKM